MQRFAFRSGLPSTVNWRPLLCVAGAAAAAATIYYFSRRRNRQRSREEAEELTVIEAPVAVCSQHEPIAPPQSPLRPPSPPQSPLRTPSNPGFSCPTAPEAAGDDAAPQSHPSAPSSLVPLAEPQPDPGSPSERAAEVAGDDPAPQSHPSAPSPPVPLAEPQPDPRSPSESAAEAAGDDASSLSEEWLPPHVTPVAPSPPQPQGDPASTEQSAPEASGDSASPQSRQISCPQAPPLPPSPPHSAPELPSSTQSAPEAAADLTVPPEAYQVPALYTYFAMKSPNFPLRLAALRQAFTLVLSNSHHAKYISIAGRVLLGGLAARNARELPAFQEAYARLVAFAQDASHREAICTELAQVGIQHFNLLDIVFELVLMGVLQGARPPIYPTPGGFLGHLVDMICSFSPVSTQRRPRADKYLFLLLDEAMLLLEEILGREEHVYMDPGSLALTLWDCLEKHVQQLLARLQGV
ncbi:protein transport protein sec31-like [Colossoma macropomum]|uniref:protein transport protein sec31-like n=1 Tax=Colossoma macropomum TaxID=42526 RepID=UPI001863EF51|nr:protein transport protein sec31-like [Colossoma macropomum]